LSAIRKSFISEEYLKSLGKIYTCPKGCGGTMIEVYVRYDGDRELKKEFECSKCGKIVKGLPVYGKQKKYKKHYRPG